LEKVAVTSHIWVKKEPIYKNAKWHETHHAKLRVGLSSFSPKKNEVMECTVRFVKLRCKGVLLRIKKYGIALFVNATSIIMVGMVQNEMS
jgi:hypothetical protein